MDESTSPAPTAEQLEALEIARDLIKHGIPVFAAPPCPAGCGRDGHRGGGQEGEYDLPAKWEKTVPSEIWLERWRPGWALAAVGGEREGGQGADFLDGDPRNDGDASLRRLHEDDIFPVTFGHQKTPSGGYHWVIAPTGLRKATGERGGFLPGLDLQSGEAGGEGRGFVWIAPTVRRSKVDGELRAYRWMAPPDMEALAEAVGNDDTRIDGLRELINGNRARRLEPRERESAPARVPTAEDPFLSAQDMRYVTGDRAFTMVEAQEFVRPALIELQTAQIGQIEETCNVAAATLSHFVPAFWSVDEAMDLLRAMLAHTAYDPGGPSNWTAEKFRAVLDGRRPPMDAWTAQRRPEPAAPPAAVVEAEPGEEKLTTLEKLRRRLVSADDLAAAPNPEPLVHGLLDLDTEAWMIGAPGSLKSFVSLDLAAAVGGGHLWQGRRVERRDVLYIAAEGQRGMVLRTRAWIKRNGPMTGVTFLPYPVQVKSNDGQWEALVQLAGELRPGLIVIDTQARVSVGLEENSATDMGVLISAVGRLKRATGACVLVIHHTGRNGGDARGSSALDGAQDTELKVVRAEPRSSLQCKIVQDKQKDMAEGDLLGIPLQFEIVDLGQDERTGRELSSLVIGEFDPFRSAEGITAMELEPWKGRQPQDWTKLVPGVATQAKVKRRILQVLADHAHTDGITEATAKRIVTDRWEEPSPTGWTDAWQSVKEVRDLVINVRGERWGLDFVQLRALAERSGETLETFSAANETSDDLEE